MAESNLARSLFSGQKGQAPRKKAVSTQVPAQESAPEALSKNLAETSSDYPAVDSPAISSTLTPPSGQLSVTTEPMLSVVAETEISSSTPPSTIDSTIEVAIDSTIEATTGSKIDSTIEVPVAAKTNSQSTNTSLNISPNTSLSVSASISDADLAALRQEIVELRRNASRASQLESQWESQYQDKSAYAKQLESEVDLLKSNHTQATGVLVSQLAHTETLVLELKQALKQQEQDREVSLAAIQQIHNEQISQQADLIVSLETQNQELQGHQQQLTLELERSTQNLAVAEQATQQIKAQLTEGCDRQVDLETQMLKQLSGQAMLQQTVQDLSDKYAIAQLRLQEMEQQVAELQEQVLKQAGQAAEYEAAIQHWKDQSVNHQRHAVQLSGALERMLEAKETHSKKLPMSELSPDSIAERAAERAKVATLEKSVAAASASKPHSKIDLPGFLLRQR